MSVLAGRSVLVTRPRGRAADLVALLEERGARAVLLPAIATIPPENVDVLHEALRRLAAFDWIVFTSAAAVDAVFDALAGESIPGSTRVAAVGPATADAVRARGADVHAVPEMFRGEEVAAALGDCRGARVLVPRSDIARPETVAMLRAEGAVVEDVVAYRTVPATSADESIERVLAGIDAILFTSPSGVRGLAGMVRAPLAHVASHATIACIGPVTSAAARESGLTVHVEPGAHTTGGMLAALETYWAPAAPVPGVR